MPAPTPAAADDEDRAHGLELCCAQLVALLAAAPRLPAPGVGRVVVELEAPLIDQVCDSLRYLLGLRRV